MEANTTLAAAAGAVGGHETLDSTVMMPDIVLHDELVNDDITPKERWKFPQWEPCSHLQPVEKMSMKVRWDEFRSAEDMIQPMGDDTDMNWPVQPPSLLSELTERWAAAALPVPR
jgi:hypothetical protein